VEVRVSPKENSMRLHVLPLSPRAIKVIALKNHLDVACDVQILDYLRADQRQPTFLALNPNGRQPLLEDAGYVLWESNAILHYLACKKPGHELWPSTAREQSDVLRWLFWESSHWDQAFDILITERFKKSALVTEDSGRRTRGRTSMPAAPDAARIAEGERYVRELAAVLDGHLRGRRWLSGDGPTIADFAVAAWIPGAAPVGCPLERYGEIVRWYDAVQSLHGWNAALPPPM
jgi:glutathione S-transferase